jgi:hypothetical protein
MEAVTAADISAPRKRRLQPARLVVAASGALSEKRKRDRREMVKNWR